MQYKPALVRLRPSSKPWLYYTCEDPSGRASWGVACILRDFTPVRYGPDRVKTHEKCRILVRATGVRSSQAAEGSDPPYPRGDVRGLRAQVFADGDDGMTRHGAQTSGMATNQGADYAR